MRKFLSLIFIVFLSLAFSAGEIEAARFGGGRSLGRSSPSYSRQIPSRSPSSSYTNPRTPLSAAPGSSGMRRWLGPLMGFAAGGLLASLFFGHGFEGFQIMDFLILIGLGVGIYFLFKRLRGRNQVTSSSERFAVVGPGNIGHFRTSNFGSDFGNMGINAHPVDANYLDWFDEGSFLQNARTYFLSLQAAWDANRMEEIKEYVTPELYRDLMQQRATLGANFTEVLNLNVDFLGLAIEGNTVFAGVRYTGIIREQQGANPQPFNETWHIQRSLSDPNASWYVAGIQQSQ